MHIFAYSIEKRGCGVIGSPACLPAGAPNVEFAIFEIALRMWRNW
ncbi:MAG: hypothetical protein WC868_08775 [Bacteroidales bacterium]